MSKDCGRLGALPRDVIAPDAVDLTRLQRLHDRRLVEQDLRDELLDLERAVRVPVVVEAVDDDLLALRPGSERVGAGADDADGRRSDLVPVLLDEGLRSNRSGHGREGVGEVSVRPGERDSDVERPRSLDILDTIVEGREVRADVRVAVSVQAEGDILRRHVRPVMELHPGAQLDHHGRGLGELPLLGEIRLELPCGFMSSNGSVMLVTTPFVLKS